jgi:hypothetical protein
MTKLSIFSILEIDGIGLFWCAVNIFGGLNG